MFETKASLRGHIAVLKQLLAGWEGTCKAITEQRDALRAENVELRRERGAAFKERDEARGCVGRNDLLVVGKTPSQVRVYLNGAYVPQIRSVEAAQHPSDLREVKLLLFADCKFVDEIPKE